MDKTSYDILMQQADNKLKVVLKNQLQADVFCTTEEANKAIDHLLDILDAHKQYKYINKLIKIADDIETVRKEIYVDSTLNMTQEEKKEVDYLLFSTQSKLRHDGTDMLSCAGI